MRRTRFPLPLSASKGERTTDRRSVRADVSDTDRLQVPQAAADHRGWSDLLLDEARLRAYPSAADSKGAYLAGQSTLARVPLFAGLAATELEDLAASSRYRRFNKGAVIFHKDDLGNCLFVIEEGSVKVGRSNEDGKEIILTVLGRGDYFGELALLDGEPRSADAVALDQSLLLALDRSHFLGFLEQHPKAALALMTNIGRQFRRLTDQVQDAMFLDVSARLARTLLRLTESDEGAPNEVRLTQVQIGSMVGATRESVNKWLGYFERRAIIRRTPRGIAVTNRDGLQSYTNEL